MLDEWSTKDGSIIHWKLWWAVIVMKFNSNETVNESKIPYDGSRKRDCVTLRSSWRARRSAPARHPVGKVPTCTRHADSPHWPAGQYGRQFGRPASRSPAERVRKTRETNWSSRQYAYPAGCSWRRRCRVEDENSRQIPSVCSRCLRGKSALRHVH